MTPVQAQHLPRRHIAAALMREPVVAYLGAAGSAGAVWLYRRRGSGPAQLIARLAGSAGRLPQANTEK